MTSTRRHINIQQTRERLGCSRRQVYILFEEGAIEGFRIGARCTRIYEDSVDRYISSNSNRI